MKTPVTPQEKEFAKRRFVLQGHCNRILSSWSFRQIKYWSDVYKFTTVPAVEKITWVKVGALQEHLETAVSLPELKEYINHLKENLEAAIFKETKGTNGSTVEEVKDLPPTILVEPKVVIEPTLEPAKKVTITTTEEVVGALVSSNNYGLTKSPNEKAFFYWFQKKAITEIMDGILKQKKISQCVISGTGTGKTFMCGGVVRRLVDMNFHVGKTFGVANYLYVTRATIVEQTKRVFKDTFGLGIAQGVEILNIEQLRSRAGQAWVNEKVRIVNGNEEYYWEWKKGLAPCVIIWDECQALKNSISTQHKIAAALNDLPGVIQLHVSATPFTRVSEAKCFAVSTGKDITQLLGTPASLTNHTWATYSRTIAQGDPEEYNEAAVERLIKDLEEFIVRVKGVKPQFDAINSVKKIKFATKEEQEFYLAAWERYLKEKAELDRLKELNGDASTGISELVAFLKFRMAAELCRAEYLARVMYESVTLFGKAAVAALNFKATIIAITKIFCEKYGIPRNKITLIWGGGQTQLTDKQKAKQKILDKKDQLAAAGLNLEQLMEDLDLEGVEDRILEELPEHLRLGPQSREERQREIDRFQSGKSDYCLFTFRAGGVGLSLHHTDEFTKEKVRHKESGYAVEEDIPKIPIRPRKLFAAPTYSAIEIVQGLGRCPRLTSLSDTEQELIFYSGTIEEEVADIVSQKLRCLSKVVKTREKWSDIVTEGVGAKAKHMQDLPPDDPNEDNPLEGGNTEED
jgi:hypothetical protein